MLKFKMMEPYMLYMLIINKNSENISLYNGPDHSLYQVYANEDVTDACQTHSLLYIWGHY